MKKTVIIAISLLLCLSAYAQENPAKVKLGGFIRQYTVVDTRAVKAGTQDLYFYMPQDISLNSDGEDLNDGLTWRSPSLTSRLWIDVKDYKWQNMSVTGRVEADFYSLNGTSASTTVAQLRLRRAFVKLGWDEKPYTLLVGQDWHPLAADLPHMTNLESGAPFNPFNRSPQVTFDYKVKDFTFTGSLLYLNHYLPTGPSGKSMDYYKYGFPELYLGVSYKKGGLLARAGVDVINSKPIGYVGYNNTTVIASDGASGYVSKTVTDDSKLVRGYTMDKKVAKASGILTAISPFVYCQYTKDLFQVKAKAILAQSGEQFNLLSGYGLASADDTKYEYTYTPMQDLASFVSFQYGKKFQVLGMIGYMKQLGTTRDLLVNASGAPTDLWLNGAADTRIQQAFRATPTVAWNFGKFTVSLEYNFTAAEFGNSKAAGYSDDAKRASNGLFKIGDTHWVHNHRFICMTKFTF